MASSYSHMITFLESALKLVHRLGKGQFGAKAPVICSMKIGVRNLKSLLVCLGKLDDDRALRIERMYPRLEAYVGDLRELRFESTTMEMLEELHGFWKSVVAADDELSNGGMQLEADEVLSIIISVVDNTADFLTGLSYAPVDKSTNGFEFLESFGVQMKFIKHLLSFARQMQMQASVEELLLFHIQPIAINAATVFSQGSSTFLQDIDSYPVHHFLGWYKEVESKCSTVNHMAADAQVWKAYARAFTAIRHAPNLMSLEEDAEKKEEANDWVEDAKAYYHWAIGALTQPAAKDDDEEGASDFEKMMGQMEKMMAKTKADLVFGGDDDDDTKVEEEEEDILKAFLDSFVSLLWDILRRQSESRVKDQYKLIYEKLRFSRAIWKKNGMDKSMRGQIRVLICDAGAFIFSLHQTDDPGRFSDLLESFDVFHAQFELETIPSFKVDADQTIIKISDYVSQLFFSISGRGLDYFSPTTSHQHSYSSLPQVVGFKEDELRLLLDRLTRGSKELCIIPICGMPGLGKTTLALKLYNHPSIKDRFQARAWCTISQVLDKKKVLVQLLNQIQPDAGYSKMTEEDLADKLRRSLKGKPYLIMLDDIWIADAWDMLKASFPNDSKSSRIIFTSRSLDIVPQAQHDQQPHLLRLRSHSESFDILESKVPHKESWNTELVMEIAEKCNGLPLTVTIVAGLLATSEPESWKGILDHLSSGGVSGCAESALEFSYRHLPDYLQACFLYFGAFPEDVEVPVKRLIRMWMAEGFVGKTESKRIEDVAQEYVEKLIERSLVMAVKGRSTGGVSSCRIHDVVHDFCRSKAKQENLFHLLLQSQDQLSDFNEPCNLQRLFIHSPTNHFMETRLFCPRAQSIMFFTAGKSHLETHLLEMSFIIQVFHMLKVLDISQIPLMNDIPSAIHLLTQLRYFAITSYVPVIPSSIGNLSNLETFIAHFCDYQETDFKRVEQVSFPHTIWNLKKLRYLRASGLLLTLPIESLDNSSRLLELETLDGVCFYSDDGSMEKQMKRFPNIRTLKCTILQRSEFPSIPVPEGAEKIVIPEFLSQLESLAMRGNGGVKFELGSRAKNLRKLKLEKIQMSREDVAIIGRFPNLEVLILSDIFYMEKQLEMEEEEFTKLRILKLISSESLERWTCSDDQAFCLEKLVFEDCENLEEIPSSWLGDISTLEEIQVHYCSSTLESAVRNIEEVQKDYGNSVQVHILDLIRK